MKRANSILCCVLFGMVVLLPFGKLLSSSVGYTFEIFSVPAFSVIMALLSVCVVVLDVTYKKTIDNKAVCVLVAIMIPISIINTALYMILCGQIIVWVSTAVCTGCCIYLAVKHGKPIALKVTALVLSALIFWLSYLFAFLSLFPIGQNTVVKTVESPSGKYYAEVIDSDQGALGGDTIVNVYEKWEINLLLFKIEKKPQQVYFGDWGAFKNMKIYWKNDHCIVVNSVEHEIE